MKYIFDFDRTLFDTDAFKAEQRKRLVVNSVRPLEGVSLSTYVFEDAFKFLREHDKGDMCIVSSCSGFNGVSSLTFQKAKIEGSGVTEYVSAFYVVPEGKEETLKNLSLQPDAVFVDDMTKHLYAAREARRDLRVVRIARDAVTTKESPDTSDSAIPVVTNLLELDAIIETL